MVRDGEERDVPAIVRMAEAFWQHTVYPEPYCSETVDGMARVCMDHGLLAVLEIDEAVVGFACGVKGGLLGNSSVPVGTEVAWWIDPEHRAGRNGIALLRHLEDQARKLGIKYWNMVFMQSSMPEHVEQLYQRLGYEKTEVVYSRVL